MPLSYATFTGNSGSPQHTFTIPYNYILKDHIKVYYGRDILANTQTSLLVSGTDYNFTSDTTIQLIGSTLNSGTTTGNPHNLANGVVLTLERDTPDSSQIVEFADGSNLIGDNLNNANLQNLFVVQEQQDKNDLSAAKAISSETASTTATNNVATLTSSQFNKDGSVPMTGDINANSNKIKNLADPTNAQDGVTKAYLERSGSITSTQIADGTIVDADINASANITGSKLQAASGSNPGSMSSADKTKLDTIETSAKDDQTGAEIKSLYEGENDTNAFTDAEKSKLQNIESNAKDDQTGAEIKGLYEGENNTNAFTDAEQTKLSNLDLTKLQNIEVNATQDQTDAEIKTAYENNANTNAFTDTEKSKLQGIENNAKDDQTASEIKTLYESNNNTNPLTDAEKAVIDGVTANTSELNKLDGFTGSVTDLNEVVTGKNVVEQITGSATDAQIPTAQAVNERVVELVTEVGGFHPIANETSFPTTNPDINDGAGTIVSLKALTSSFSTGSGVTTHTFTNGAGAGNNVIINGLPSSTTFQAGKGLLLETTTTLHTYTYHRLVLDESGVSNADALVNNFNERYYGPLSSNPATRPSGANRLNGDLYFNSSDGKMKVYNGTHASGTWDDVAAPGNFFINTLSSSSNSGGGSATFNGTATRFTLSSPPNEAQQLLVSINGVIQKPNAGTSPSEGFAISGADIIFASAPPSGASYFIVTIGSSVNIGTPSDNTVTSAKIVDGSIVNADISGSAAIAKSKLASLDIVNADVNASAAIAGSKLADNSISLAKLEHGTSSNNGKFLRANNGADPTFESVITDLVNDTSPQLGGTLDTNGNLITFGDSSGATDDRLKFGVGADLSIYHNATDSYIENKTNDLYILTSGSGDDIIIKSNDDIFIQPQNGEDGIKVIGNGAVELYYDNTKRVETTGAGISVTGHIDLDDNEYLRLGSSNDMLIGHAGSSGFIRNDNGEFYLRADGIRLVNQGNDETYIKCIDDGAVELYHNNSKKFETHSAGVLVSGNVYANDNNKFIAGTSNDLQIYHDGSHSYIKDGGTGQLRIQSDAFSVESSNGFENMIFANENGAVNLYYDNSSKLATTSNGVQMSGNVFVQDGYQLRLGDDNDAQLYHSGNNLFLSNVTGYTRINVTNGSLYLDGNSIFLRSGVGDEHYIKCVDNGAVELYYDNARKFSTTADGGELLGGGSNNVYLNLKTSDNTVRGYVYANSSNKVGFLHEGGSWVAQFDRATDCFLTGNWLPDADNTYNLGSTSKRWKNVYTNDLNLSNEGHGNDVDGTWGSYTIQEGAEDLFLINKRTGKKYKFNVTEVA